MSKKINRVVLNKIFSILFVAIVFVSAVSFINLPVDQGGLLQHARAATGSDLLMGYAWSDNVGWVSFNCNNNDSCGVVNYGVNIDNAGKFSGYAWSDNVGWIDFGPSGPYPESPDYSVRINKTSGSFSGWAKVIAGDDAIGDGWDGWIKMSGDAVGSEGGDPEYEVAANISDGTVGGQAWGSDVFGWLDFSAVVNLSDNCPPGDICEPVICDENNPSSCEINPSSPSVSLTARWNSVLPGGKTILDWGAINVTKCTAVEGDDSWNGTKNDTGDYTTKALSSNTTYTLECTSDSGTVSDSVDITIDDPGTGLAVNLSANPSTINKGNISSLSFNSSEATVCTPTGGDAGWRGQTLVGQDIGNGSYAIDSTYTTEALNGSTNYILSCENDLSLKSGENNVTVNVESGTLPFVTGKEFMADPTIVEYGGTSKLTWQVDNNSGNISCAASGGDSNWTGDVGTDRMGDNAYVTPALTSAPSQYVLTCEDSITGDKGIGEANIGVVYYTLNIDRSALSAKIIDGNSVTSENVIISAVPAGSYTETVSLSATISPPINGATHNFSNNQLIYNAGESTYEPVTYSITIPPDADDGEHQITITGNSGGVLSTRTIDLNLEEIADIFFEEI